MALRSDVVCDSRIHRSRRFVGDCKITDNWHLLARLRAECLYFARATSILPMTECHAFSFTAADPLCHGAMYWSKGAVAMFSATCALIVVAAICWMRSHAVRR